MSISGVQPKLPAVYDQKKKLYVVDPYGEYILKPQTQSFSHIPENENMCMNIAEELGIDVPFHELVEMKDGSLAYIVKRFDRDKKGKLHQEDFSQILDQDKYKGSVEAIAKRIKEISAVPGLDTQLFFDRVIFNYLIGNGDAHLKNYSIIYDNNGAKRLSPAYDLVSSKLVIPKEEESAIAINGKKNNLSIKDFEAVAESLNIPKKVRYRLFEGKKNVFIKHATDSFLPEENKETFIALVEQRSSTLRI
ncbi:MAG: HipA domain-containing protein [Candidatus Omnitrophica bacterium]|nr:HipA domain-containing protein [Candidatus Omnitrophota bacterium]